MLTLGSLFSGFGGLDLAIEHVFGARTAWVSDIEPGPCKVLAHRWPGVPNLGDITAVDWSTVEPVDIIAGGSPCQDISSAGRMAGMREGTRSNLWVQMREAIATLRPRYVVWENVGAARSTAAASAMECDPGLLGDHPAGVPVLRALGRVLGDLASLGYDAQWHSLRAADVGAPHGRLRFFVLAADADHAGRGEHGWPVPVRAEHAAAQRRGDDAGLSLLPTPRTSDTNGAGAHGDGGIDLRTAVTLLPSPVAQPSGNSAEEHLRKKPGRQKVTDLAIIVENGLLETGGRLLPTPRATDGTKGGPNQRGSSGDLMLPSAVAHLPTPRATRGGSSTETVDLLPTPRASDGPSATSHNRTWSSTDNSLHTVAHNDAGGPYAAAIARWEAVVGPAPSPTKPGRNGRPKLNPAFAEWMMGAPAGWITDTPGVTDNEALRMAGNGVVQQQAEAALRIMLDRMARYAA